MNDPRPLLRYFGGKARLRRWILAHLPRHPIYFEPFVGAGSILFAKPHAPMGETINDLDGEIVGLFRILRGPDAPELIRQIALTPYARAEHALAYEPADCPIERARRLIVRTHFSHGTMATQTDRPRNFSTDGTTGKTNRPRQWGDMPEALTRMVERLDGVCIEQRDALDLIGDFSDPKALIYADPPYLHATRSPKPFRGGLYHAYAHEMSDDDHARMLDRLDASQAMVVISGYDNPLYAARLAHWTRVDKATTAHRDAGRTESLWINPAARRALDIGPLFGGAC